MEFQLSDVVGYDLLQPLATLLEGLDYADPTRDHYLPPAILVSGYAAASIVMAVVTLESFIGAAQYVLHPAERPNKVFEFVKIEYPGSEYLQPLREVFVLRDAIAHGHMWRRTITEPNPGSPLQYGQWEMHDGYGDKKFKDLVDLSTQTTKTLLLNIKPSRLTARDVGVVLRTVFNFLVFLGHAVSQSTGRDPQGVINVENQRLMFRGKIVTFPEVVDAVSPRRSTTY